MRWFSSLAGLFSQSREVLSSDSTEVQLLNTASGPLVCMVWPTGGYGTCTMHQCSAAKVTVLMVMPVGNPDMQSCGVTSSGNLEVAICPCPIVKVTIIMVMSSGNPDVMSCPWKTHASCWISPSMGVTGKPARPTRANHDRQPMTN